LEGRLCAMVFKYGVKCNCGILMIMLQKCPSDKRLFQLTRKILLFNPDCILYNSMKIPNFWPLFEYCMYPRNGMELHAEPMFAFESDVKCSI
jgi:hypothetical protein